MRKRDHLATSLSDCLRRVCLNSKRERTISNVPVPAAEHAAPKQDHNYRPRQTSVRHEWFHVSLRKKIDESLRALYPCSARASLSIFSARVAPGFFSPAGSSAEKARFTVFTTQSSTRSEQRLVLDVPVKRSTDASSNTRPNAFVKASWGSEKNVNIESGASIFWSFRQAFMTEQSFAANTKTSATPAFKSSSCFAK